MPYLVCLQCRFGVATSGAGNPLQNCPRCLLHENKQRRMEPVSAAGRFRRVPVPHARIGETPARLGGSARGAR